MRFSVLLVVLSVFFTVFAGSAQAYEKKWWHWIFPPDLQDNTRVYLNDGKTPQMAIYEMDEWTPEVWTENRGSEKALMDDFYINGIITDQSMEDDVPVLEVGQHFMELSGNDKRKVAEYVDHVFGITQKTEKGMFFLEHWKTGDTIGIYNKDGLQLQ